MKLQEKFIAWLLVSSADPEKFSMTVKGMLLQYASFVIFVAQILKIPLTESEYVSYVGLAVATVGTLLGMFGLLRKFYYELKS